MKQIILALFIITPTLTTYCLSSRQSEAKKIQIYIKDKEITDLKKQLKNKKRGIKTLIFTNITTLLGMSVLAYLINKDTLRFKLQYLYNKYTKFPNAEELKNFVWESRSEADFINLDGSEYYYEDLEDQLNPKTPRNTLNKKPFRMPSNISSELIDMSSSNASLGKPYSSLMPEETPEPRLSAMEFAGISTKEANSLDEFGAVLDDKTVSTPHRKKPKKTKTKTKTKKKKSQK